MATDGVMKHLRMFMDQISNYTCLEAAGFKLSDVEVKAATEFDIVEEDEYAHFFGLLELQSIARRGKRLLPLVSWPYRLHRCNNSEELAKATCTEFRSDHLL